MTLNPSTQSNSAVEVIDGTVSEFYSVMDQCIRRSEVMPGQYKSITSPSYSNNCPITESSFTTVDVGCPAPQVVDINNSFITATIKVPFTIPAGVFKSAAIGTKLFIGWRSSLDILERYIIYCNHKVVTDQAFVGEESFILQSLIPEHVRCRRPYQYTTYENASSLSPNVCGVYVDIKSTQDGTALNSQRFEVAIPIKLDLNQFLLFQNWKYSPAFNGTWSIKLYPTTKHLIVCPVNPKAYLTPEQILRLAVGKNTKTDALNDYSHHFVQTKDTFKCYTYFKIDAADADNCAIEKAQTHLTFGKCTVEDVLYHQTQFELMYDIYDGLKARYMQRPLTIPVNKLDYGRFSGVMSNGAISSTYTVAISNCESLFILPFVDDNHHTICFNPQFDGFFMNISGYGNFPQQPFNTYGSSAEHTRFLNMTLDALNMNNSPIMAPNKDLMNSLETSTRTEFALTNGSQATLTTIDDKNHDRSNFLMGIPFSNDIDFQGGLTSNGNINIKLSATSSKIDTISNDLTGNKNVSIGATVMFCKDAALMIKPVPFSDQPEARLIEDRIV